MRLRRLKKFPSVPAGNIPVAFSSCSGYSAALPVAVATDCVFYQCAVQSFFMENAIQFSDFLKVQILSGTVLEAALLEGARKPAYRLLIDFGPMGVKKSSAQLTGLYTPGELVGRTVMAVTNFVPKQIGSFMSDVLVLGFPVNDREIVLACPEREVPPGTRLL